MLFFKLSANIQHFTWPSSTCLVDCFGLVYKKTIDYLKKGGHVDETYSCANHPDLFSVCILHTQFIPGG